MNKQLWMAAVAACTLALGACGGEDSTPPPVSSAPSPSPTPSPSPPPIVSAFDSNPTLLPDLTPVYETLCGAAVNVQAAVAANLSGHKDGRKDLVFTLWCQPEVGTVVNEPTLSGLIVLKQESDGTFTVGTKQIFGVDFVGLDGGVGILAIAEDFNNDGYDEVVVAITGEDGRQLPVGFTGYNKRMLFLTSGGEGSYKAELIGHPSYNYSAFTVKNSLGGKDLLSTAIGYGGKDQAFRLTNGSWSPALDYEGLPSLRGSFFSSEGAVAVDRAIINDSGTSLSYFTKNQSSLKWDRSEGSWTFANVRNANFRSWNGDEGNLPIVSFGDTDYAFISFDYNCNLKIEPSGSVTSLFAVPAEKVSGGYDGRFLVESSSDFVPAALLLFYDIDGEEIKNIDVPVRNFENEFRLFNTLCTDLNSDGYDDIFVGGWANGIKPRILINDKSGGFSAILDKNIPYPSGINYDVASIFSDIDGDGNLDLLYWPLNGVGSLDGGVRYHIFKGQRAINQSDF